MIKILENFDDYGIPWRGDTKFHQEVAWFATGDDRVLGVVVGAIVRDRIDNDFGWVLLGHVDLVGRDNEDDFETSAGCYRAVEVTVLRPSQAAATEELHAATLAAGAGRGRLDTDAFKRLVQWLDPEPSCALSGATPQRWNARRP